MSKLHDLATQLESVEAQIAQYTKDQKTRQARVNALTEQLRQARYELACIETALSSVLIQKEELLSYVQEIALDQTEMSRGS